MDSKDKALMAAILSKFGQDTSIVSGKVYTEETKQIIMVMGKVGAGKTSWVYDNFPGHIVTFCFDRKSARVYNQYIRQHPEEKDRIKVFDVYAWVDEVRKHRSISVAERTEIGVLVVNYVTQVLEELATSNWKVDVGHVDGIDRYIKESEMNMRYMNKLPPASGVSNRSAWNLRNIYLQQFHESLVSISKLAVVYAAYIKEDDEIDEDDTKQPQNQQIQQKPIGDRIHRSKWVDAIEMYVETFVYIENRYVKERQKMYYTLEVISSKDERFLRTGAVYDITDHKRVLTEETFRTLYPKLYANSSLSEKYKNTQRKEEVVGSGASFLE